MESPAPEGNAPVAATAARELARLQEEVSQTRALLIRMRKEAAQTQAPEPAEHIPRPQLQMANEQLVLAILHNQRKAENALKSVQQVAQRAREDALAASERRHVLQMEANANLVLSALSARDRLDAADRARDRQTRLLAVVAHELRNPLGPIRNAAMALGRLPSKGPMQAQLQGVIERQVGHMTRLVGDLLDVSRVSTGKLRIERRPIDMVEVIAQAAESHQSAARVRGQRLHVRLPAGALPVNGDPVRLSQVLNNLLDNACKYTQEGGEIALSVIATGPVLVIRVRDNGIGISAEALPLVFDPFVQELHATEFNGVGLGIGLTMVRELVEAHGGSVVATSAGTGLGSEFIVTLPLMAGRPAP